MDFSIRDMGSPVTWTERWVLARVDGDVVDRSGIDPDQTRAWGEGWPGQRPLLAGSTGIIQWGYGAFRKHRRISFRVGGMEHSAYGLCVIPDQALGTFSGRSSLAGKLGRSS